MPVPTSGVTFSSIQTEFGGSNPISVSEYYRGGANVPSNQTTSGTDGTAISTSGTIRIGMFRGLTETAAGAVSSSYHNKAFSQQGGGEDGWCDVGVIFNTNGFISTFIDGSGTMVANSSPLSDNLNGSSWFLPNTTNIGSSYWVRATILSGSGAFGTYNTWLQLTTSRNWFMRFGNNTAQDLILKMDIAASSGGAVLATGNITLYGQAGNIP